MSDTTTATTATEPSADPAPSWGGWRDRPLAELDLGNSVLNHTLHSQLDIKTLGDLDRELRNDPTGPPLRLTDSHRTLCEDHIDAVAKGDPAHRPFDFEVPVILPDDPASPEALAEYDQETARLVTEAEGEVSELEAAWEDKHGEASIAKKEFESARDKMRALIRTRKEQRGKRPERTLFDGIASDDADPNTPDPLADLWQQYPLDFAHWERFGLTEKDIEKLNAGETKNHGTHPMATLGDVTRFITPNPSNPAYARTLKDVKGFGDKGMERWTEAETKFWGWYGNGGKGEYATETGAADGAEGGEGDAEAGAEQPPKRLQRNEQTGELETVGEQPKKAKRKKVAA